MARKYLTILVFNLILVDIVYGSANIRIELETTNPAFDPQYYEDLLDPDLCQQQLSYIRNASNALLRFRCKLPFVNPYLSTAGDFYHTPLNTVLFQHHSVTRWYCFILHFRDIPKYSVLEAGLRLPKGLLEGNFVDLGNYYQCLGIDEDTGNSVIEGKYCIVSPSFEGLSILAENFNWEEFDQELHSSENLYKLHKQIEPMQSRHILRTGPSDPALNDLGDFGTKLAVCIPKACTLQEGIEGLNLFNITILGVRFEEQYCRVKNDKPWVTVDYVAVSIFSLLGLLTLLSTGYDIWHIFIARNDPKTVNTLYRSFSVYTNGKRLTTFTPNPKNLDCMDGVRMLSMLWVIVGHTYSTVPPVMNLLYAYTDWLIDIKSLWISSANFAVDTFFVLTGILTVYTTAGKLTSMKLLKNLHFYYLNRLLRMFPLLATVILLQASVFFRVADGPLWAEDVASNVNNCRTYWWTTLLYVQNWVNPTTQCINHGWYLAIDIQIHIVSPLVLFWVLTGNKKKAWIGLIGGLLVILTATAVYCFINQFPGWTLAPSRGEKGIIEYFLDYYFNTMTRAPPFFVGMIFGYLLHIYQGKRVNLHPSIAILFWSLATFSTMGLVYVTHLMKDSDNWVYPIADDFMNTFGRSVWAVAVGWVVFACKHGMGGPINWFLSLNMWKLPSRVSYGLYLFSYQIQFLIYGTVVAPIYFSDGEMLYQFAGQLLISFLVAFFATLLIDSPFSILFKMLLGDGPKKPRKEPLKEEEPEKGSLRKEKEDNASKETSTKF